MSEHSEREENQDSSDPGIHVPRPGVEHSMRGGGEEEREMGGSSSLSQQTEELSPGELEKGRKEKVHETSGREATADDGDDPNLVRVKITWSTQKRAQKVSDNIHMQVTWTGPDDPGNPKNWTFKRKWLATGLVSLIAFMTPMTSSMIAPARDAIDNDLHVHSTIESELIFSIFLLAFVIGPLFLAPLSEYYGRVIILQLSNVVRILLAGFNLN